MATIKEKDQRTKSAKPQQQAKPRCGLCGKMGKTRKLRQTECCQQWICDDEDAYVLFSYAKNSCSRNHNRYTLCSYHYNEGHLGKWQDCSQCFDSFETEIYVWYGTNEYNFEKLQNPPSYEPTHCTACRKAIKLGLDGYSIKGKEYYCETCSMQQLSGLLK